MCLLYINQAVETVDPELIGKLRLIEIPDGPRVLERHRQLKEINGQAVIAVRLPLSARSSERALELTQDGIEILHFTANELGREQGKIPGISKTGLKKSTSTWCALASGTRLP